MGASAGNVMGVFVMRIGANAPGRQQASTTYAPPVASDVGLARAAIKCLRLIKISRASPGLAPCPAALLLKRLKHKDVAELPALEVQDAFGIGGNGLSGHGFLAILRDGHLAVTGGDHDATGNGMVGQTDA